MRFDNGFPSSGNDDDVMARITDELRRALQALAFAESGEMLSTREKSLHLSGERERPPVGQRISPNRREIVLSLGACLPEGVMRYVIGTCSRMEAELAVLSRGARAGVNALLQPYRGALREAGIPWRVVALAGGGRGAWDGYLRANPQVLFMVSAGEDDPLRTLVGGSGRARRTVLPVPLVMIGDLR